MSAPLVGETDRDMPTEYPQMCSACHKLFYITMRGGHFCSQQCIANTAQSNDITEEEVRTISHQADFGTRVVKDDARNKLCRWMRKLQEVQKN